MLFPTLRSFYYDYQLPLAHALYHIEQRGLLMDTVRLDALRKYIDDELQKECLTISDAIKLPVFSYKQELTKAAKLVKTPSEGYGLCLNSPQDVAKIIQWCGLKVPTSRKTHNATTDDATLHKLFGESGNPVLKSLLATRELVKIKGTYVDTQLYNSTLYCSYISIGTVTGRRSSRANFLGLGTNGQNIPKHSKLGKMFRHCIISRPGKIFLACDQKGAEDWLVQGIIADVTGNEIPLNELRAGINRHRKLAAFLFGRPESDCTKDSMHYYLGKRTRHAGHYDMREQTMSTTFAREGHAIPPNICRGLLDKFHQAEPDIQKGFQAYVINELTRNHELITPIGRRRTFLALRSYSDNSSVFREGFAYIPQSSVGDNTGLAIVHCERQKPGLVVADGHDAVYLEIDDSIKEIKTCVALLTESFNRTLTLPVRGVELKIPVEMELGYNLRDMVTFEPEGLDKAYETAKADKTLDSVIH
jgi:DNA polymerase I-like protein with 3'-5' exonuclease and polymerase domains